MALLSQADINQLVEEVMEIVGFDVNRSLEIRGTQFVVVVKNTQSI